MKHKPERMSRVAKTKTDKPYLPTKAAVAEKLTDVSRAVTIDRSVFTSPGHILKAAGHVRYSAGTDVSVDKSSALAGKILEEYHQYFESPSNKLKTIKSGLRSAAIKDLLDLTGANQSDMAQILSLTEPTLRKYIKMGKSLNSAKSEHIIEVFELFEKGLETFGSLQEFKNWLDHSNLMFEDKPLNLLDTITGINMVKNALLRIDYGFTA